MPFPERERALPFGAMRRLVFVGLLFGLVNGAAAAAALYAVNSAAPSEFGWFAYAPLTENVVYDHYGFPWEYVVVPAVLLALNALLLPLFVQRGWLHR